MGRSWVAVADADLEGHHRPHDRVDVAENGARRGPAPPPCLASPLRRGVHLGGYLKPSLSKAACSDWT